MAQINTQPTYFNTTIIYICFDTHVHISEHNIKKINNNKKSKHGIKVMFYLFSHQINREKNNNKSIRQQQKFSLN